MRTMKSLLMGVVCAGAAVGGVAHAGETSSSQTGSTQGPGWWSADSSATNGTPADTRSTGLIQSVNEQGSSSSGISGMVTGATMRVLRGGQNNPAGSSGSGSGAYTVPPNNSSGGGAPTPSGVGSGDGAGPAVPQGDPATPPANDATPPQSGDGSDLVVVGAPAGPSGGRPGTSLPPPDLPNDQIFGPAADIPEPATLALFGLALLGLGAARRRPAGARKG